MHAKDAEYGWYLPAAQLVNEVAAAPEYVPAGQLLQVEEELAPVVFE